MGKRFMRTAVAALGLAALVVGTVAGLAPIAGVASSHREAPLTAADPQIDGTDLYAFRSPDRPKTVTFISNWIPFEEPAGGPNFFLFAPGVRYDINIDNNGDAKPDIIYRWVFKTHYRHPGSFLYNTGPVTSLSDKTLNIYQTYDLYRIKHGHRTELLKNAMVAPSDVGVASMPNYERLQKQATYSFGKGRTLAGQADDPFFLDLRVFDLAYGCAPPYPGCKTPFSEVGHDTLNGFNVNTMVLQVPRGAVRGPKGSIIGVWTTAERRSIRVETSKGKVSSKGPFVQVSRLGNPLVNEVVVPVGLKDYFNGSKPANDAQFLPAVQNPLLPHVIHTLYGLKVPDSDSSTPGIQRSDLISVFLTGLAGLNKPPGVKPSEELRLNMATPLCGRDGHPKCNRLGVIAGDPQGFPNGRRLSDDIIDIALRVVEGVLLHQNLPTSAKLGDGVNKNDVAFRPHFPYLALPHAGSVAHPHH